MQENEILRYNQGFGGFGLMEQCTDGKFTMAEDTLHLQDRIKYLKEEIKEVDRKMVLLRRDNTDLRHSAAVRTRQLSQDLKYSRKMNRFFAASYALLWIVALVAKNLWHLY